MTFAAGPHIATVTPMAPFLPNEYLFETHKDKGKEKWEIFAWAVRDAMAKNCDFGKSNADAKDKLVYKKFICGKTKEIEVNGLVFTSTNSEIQKPKQE